MHCNKIELHIPRYRTTYHYVGYFLASSSSMRKFIKISFLTFTTCTRLELGMSLQTNQKKKKGEKQQQVLQNIQKKIKTREKERERERERALIRHVLILIEEHLHNIV